MIFYHPQNDLRFSLYGIEIPIEDDRAKKVFLHLKKIIPNLKYTKLQKKDLIAKADISRVHHKRYVDKLFGSYPKLEAEMLKSYELVNSAGDYHRYNPKNASKDFKHAFEVVLNQTSMTFFATKFALKNGFAFHLGGGMHHAMSFGGRGFCVINDIVIALKKLQKEKMIKTAWVVDVDAHKGDGSAELLEGNSTIKTLSLHMAHGWPLDMGSGEEPWFTPSSIDVAILKGEENLYNKKLKAALLQMEASFGLPDVVMVVDGADPYKFDELESTKDMRLTKRQLFERDKIIYQYFKQRDIPQSFLMAGGYGKRSWEIYAQFLEFVWKDSSKRTKVSAR